jgi:hypothetical protein
MGYRSEVACVFVFEDELTRDAFHITSMQTYRDRIEKLMGHNVAGIGEVNASEVESDVEWFSSLFKERETNGMPVLLLHAEDIKWYDDFQFVKHVEEMKCECIERMGMYKYIRIGEESDDVHEDEDAHDNFPAGTYGDDFVRLSRSIYIES